MWFVLLACAEPPTERTSKLPAGDSAPGDTGDPDVVDPVDPCDEDVADPGAPTFPARIGTLTVTIKSGDGATQGTEDEDLQLCLTEAYCFPLAQADHDGLEAGEVGVWTWERLAIDRSAVDRVELRTGDGDNAWTPACVELRFDGEPVHCEDAPGVTLGSGGGSEVPSWSDPAGLHADCVTCWDGPLTHGPMVGAVTTDSARVWVRTDATRSVQLRIATDAALSDARVAAWAHPAPGDDFAAELLAECLSPATTYYYEVRVDGVAATDGPLSFTTPPLRGAGAETRIAFGSCAKLDDQPIFASVLDAAPDLFLFAGDNHYANSADLGSIRWFYRWSLERTERAALAARVPTVATWDDHDFLGNDTLGTAPGRDDALRAFTEYWANPSYGAPGAPGVYTSLAWGDVDVFLLDDRYSRGVEGTMLGSAQHAWLVDAVTASDATFKLVVSGSQWSLSGLGDSWYEYPAERDELFEALADIGGVVLLSGDIHRSELRLLDRAGAYDLPEITSSPLANLGGACAADTEERIACYAGDSFITLDIDPRPADPTLTATILDVDGAEVTSWTILRSELE